MMALLCFGKDPNTNGDDCPTVWVDEANADMVLQGWKADESTESECLTVGHIPDSDLALPGNDFWVFDDRLIRFGHSRATALLPVTNCAPNQQ
jgi:hypothetical protein